MPIMALPEAERQVCYSQRWKAGGHCYLNHISHQTVNRLPVAYHVVLGSWTVHMFQECHSLRPTPLRRCLAHLELCPHGTPRNPTAWIWQVHQMHDPPETLHV